MAPINISAKRRNPNYRTYQDNTITNNQIVPLEARGRRYIQPTLSEYVEPSIGDRILSTLASPMTALSNNRTGSRNPYDYALDMVNPFSWIQSGERAVGSLAQGQYTDAALNALGAIPAIGFADDAARFASKAGRYATTQTPLKNTYKINPWAFEPNSEAYYRGIGKEGMEDALQSGVFRPKNAANTKKEFVSSDGQVFNFGKSFDKTYYSPDFKIADRYGKGFVAEVPNNSAEFTRRYSNKDWSYHTQSQIPVEQGRILQKDWLKGYKEIDTPKSNFKSEIDWGKWNPDTPKYPELIDEYNAIEKSTKQSGTWMKNPDGSSFQGTPEQFVQQQSSYFKKAFPNILKNEDGNVQITYHGSPSKFDYFDGTIVNHGRTRGHGIYTTPSFKKASGYTKGEDGNVYEFYQNAANKQDKYFKLKQESDRKFAEFLKNNPKDSPGFDKKFNDFVEADSKTFDDLSIEEFKVREGFDFYPAELDEYVVPFTNYPKSAKNNVGFFDMTNPNIYKAVAPIGAGLGVGASQLQEKKYGGLQQSYKKTKRFK
jgi:hypothetical protein